ncbi:MAG: hypothetical protein JNL79_03535 [Myxococcales bacterium]|nr:hypothetical protein [Myxococcales bacterium]
MLETWEGTLKRGVGTSAAHATLVDKLEAAFGGDPGASIFLQAALHSARRTTLPTDRPAILDFVRAHLIDALTDELGPRAVAKFLEEISDALWLPAESAEGNATEHTSAKLRPHLRVLLIHRDRFTRANLARQLVSGGCDVTVLESVAEVTFTELPSLAIVDLSASSVESLLEAVVLRVPDLPVLALVAKGVDANQLLERVGVRKYETALAGIQGTHLVERSRQLARRGDP